MERQTTQNSERISPQNPNTYLPIQLFKELGKFLRNIEKIIIKRKEKHDEKGLGIQIQQIKSHFWRIRKSGH